MQHQLTHLSDLPSWEGAARVSIDTETRDPDLKRLGPGVRRGAQVVGISFAIDRDGSGLPSCPAYYLPIRHAGGGNYSDPRQVFAYLRAQGARFRGDMVGANLGYDLDFLQEEGVEFRPRFFRDVQVSGALLLQPELKWAVDEETGDRYMEEAFVPMNLNALALREGLPGKDEAALAAWAEERGLDPKADLWRAHSSVVSRYAVQDARLPLQVYHRHVRAIHDQDLARVHDLECRLLPVLLRMRRRGVRVSLDRVDAVEREALRREAAAARAVSERSGIPFDPEDVSKAAVLEKHLAADGVRCPRTPTGLPSVKALWLSKLGTPVALAIKECRKWNKVRTTFCESVRAHQVRGRIHSTFNQLRQEREDGDQKGVGYGRLSSDAPNIQQQPAKDPEVGPMWRAIYLPDDGGQWASCDFSSQEPRWITHYAETLAIDPGSGWSAQMRGSALAAAMECRNNPDWDNHSMMAGFINGDRYSHAAFKAGDKAAKEMRAQAKIIFLGKCYAMGGGKLCRSLGLPSVMVVRDPSVRGWVVHPVGTPEAGALLKAGARPFEVAGPEGQAIIDAFEAGVPYVRGLMKATAATAEERGYLRTALGRRCRFPLNIKQGAREPRYAWAHKGLNRLIQGTSADQTKLAMVNADAAGFAMQLQVHDEICLSVADRNEAERLAQVMVDALPCRVPTRVDIEIGPSWGEAH